MWVESEFTFALRFATFFFGLGSVVIVFNPASIQTDIKTTNRHEHLFRFARALRTKAGSVRAERGAERMCA
jgi:hypothetical protein